MENWRSQRVVAIDPGSTVGFAIAEVDVPTREWELIRLGNTSGIRGVWSILEDAFGEGRFPGVVILENYHIRDVRVASSAATMTTLEIWGSVHTWGAIHQLPGSKEYYPVRSQEPPATERVRAWRRTLGTNPYGNQADHPYVAAAHLQIWLERNVIGFGTYALKVNPQVWVPPSERT